MRRAYRYTAWEEDGLWTAHAKAVKGAYGIGKTRDAAARDLAGALTKLLRYVEDIGEPIPPADKRV